MEFYSILLLPDVQQTYRTRRVTVCIVPVLLHIARATRYAGRNKALR